MDAVHRDMTYREAERKCHISMSTARDRLHETLADPAASKRFALTRGEEHLIVDLSILYADRVIPLHRHNVQKAAEIIIQRMPSERQA